MAGRWFTQDKDFHDQIFMMQTIRNDILHSMQYNTSLGSGDILGSVLYKKGRLNKYAPTIMKAEQLSKWYSTHLLEQIITELTQH